MFRPSLLGAETHIRSVLKALSWRTLGTLDTFAISWFMTGRVEIAGSIAVTEVATKLLESLVTSAAPRDRDAEAQKARLRSARRFAGMQP